MACLLMRGHAGLQLSHHRGGPGLPVTHRHTGVCLRSCSFPDSQAGGSAQPAPLPPAQPSRRSGKSPGRASAPARPSCASKDPEGAPAWARAARRGKSPARSSAPVQLLCPGRSPGRPPAAAPAAHVGKCPARTSAPARQQSARTVAPQPGLSLGSESALEFAPAIIARPRLHRMLLPDSDSDSGGGGGAGGQHALCQAPARRLPPSKPNQAQALPGLAPAQRALGGGSTAAAAGAAVAAGGGCGGGGGVRKRPFSLLNGAASMLAGRRHAQPGAQFGVCGRDAPGARRERGQGRGRGRPMRRQRQPAYFQDYTQVHALRSHEIDVLCLEVHWCKTVVPICCLSSFELRPEISLGAV